MIQRSTLLKSLPAAAAGVAGASALASCGSSSSGASGGSDDTLTWMSMLHTPTTPDADGPIMEALKEHTGIDFEFQWVPDASKEEKINATVASGSVADITTRHPPVMASDPSAPASDTVRDVEEALAPLPDASHSTDDVIAAARVDGGLDGTPFQQSLARYAVLVRQDCLARLVLEVPHTSEALGE